MSPFAEKPTVLIVESDPRRRRDLSHGLAELGYEAVPALHAREGLRYIEALQPAIAVVPASLLTDPEQAARLGAAIVGPMAVIALGNASQEADLPRWALFLAEDGLTSEHLLDRLRSVILGQEVGVETDVDGSGLVGELAHHPLFELLPRFARAGAGGCLTLPSGEIHFDRGEIVAAFCSPVTGAKAFCRLAHLDRGLFHFRSGTEPVSRQFEASVQELLAIAFEDALGETLDPKTEVRLEIGANFFETQFSPTQRKILAMVRRETSVQALLDHCRDPLDGEILNELLRLEQMGHVKLSAAQAPVTIVTDSTADLPSGAVRELGIHVVPLTVTFGDQVYEDGSEFTPRQFYELLERREHHPFTTPPSQEAFAEEYRRLLEHQDVVSIHISEDIPSQTVAHARRAASAVTALATLRPSGAAARLEVVDSRQTSVPLGILVVFAARMAARGLPAEEIRQRIEEISPRLHTLLIVDTLEFLARGGRIGKAQAWIGNLLSIKPILGLEDGRIVPVERIRGGRRAQQQLLEVLAHRLDPALPVVLGVGHARAPAWADRLARSMSEKFSVLETLSSEMGPVIGTHVGPGTVGAMAFQPRAEEIPLLAPLHR